MRMIPAEIQQRLQKNVLAAGTKSNIGVHIIATQTELNTLLSETIHGGSPANYGDVAIRQMGEETEPSLAYAICIDVGGTAALYERKLPALREAPWIKRWELGAASETAIEFDGEWKINVNEKWHYLRTEATPYIFFVRGGLLHVQKWQDNTSRIVLAEGGVSEISVCRGWQSADDPTLDQGLIIGYLRSGKAFYRALCLQPSGEQVWETEREISELGGGNTSLSVFRTNDFRVGFVCENGEGIRYVLSGRTYTGQSVEQETAFAQVASECDIQMTRIRYSDKQIESETLKASTGMACTFLGQYYAMPGFTVKSTERMDLRKFVITLSHEVCQRQALEDYFIIIPDGGQSEVRPISVTTNKNVITIMADMDISKNGAVKITHNRLSNLCYFAMEGNWFLAPDFTAQFEPEPPRADDVCVMGTILKCGIIAKQITYMDHNQEEICNLNCSYALNIKATQVGDVPV